MERKDIEAAKRAMTENKESKLTIAEKKELVINSEITEHVILVTQNKSDRVAFPEMFSLNDLINEIAIFAEIANLHHQEKTGNSPNSITTVVTNEYLFYNKERPLTLEEFQVLHHGLEIIGKKFSKNLFYIFSSIPVSIPDQSTDVPGGKNRFLNCVIHMQCGPFPRMTDINKAIIPPDEISIGKNVPIGYYQDFTKPSHLPLADNKTAKFLSFFTADKNYLTFNFNHCIECESAGGAKFFRLIDLCFDHGNETAKKDFIFTINELIKNNPGDPIPCQVSHVLTANSNNINQRALTVDEKKIIHADPSYDYNLPVDDNKPGKATKQLLRRYHATPKSENKFILKTNRSLNITFCESYQLDRNEFILNKINLMKLQKYSIQFF